MSTRSRRQTRSRRHIPPEREPWNHNAAVAAEKDLRRAFDALAREAAGLRGPNLDGWSIRFAPRMPYYDREGRQIRTEEWADLFEQNEYRQICLDRNGAALISTVWLGIDHGWGMTPHPIIFETMIIGGQHNGFQQRYTTEDAARCGHMETVEALLEGKNP